jgi:Orsellinic acid/F9775 biosynthesis cluster protein D
MERYIKYDVEFAMAICVACESGLPREYVLRHFRTHHKSTWKEHKKSLMEYIAGMRLTVTQDLHYPEQIREAVNGLEIKDGWACGEDGCTMCGISDKYIENHCRNAHGQEAVQAKAWYKCRIQTLLRHPHIRYTHLYFALKRRYFIVENVESSAITQQRQRVGLDKVIRMTKAKELASRSSEHTAIDDNKLSIRTPWLNATKWMDRFAGINMEKLMELTEKPPSKDQFLSSVWKEMGDIFTVCHTGLKDIRRREWDRILHWLRSTNRTVIHSKPMTVYLQQKTVQTYAAYWQRLMCFCFRTMDYYSWRAVGQPGFKFTEAQREQLEKLRMYYEFDNGTPEESVRRNMLLTMSMLFIQQDVHTVGVPILVYFSGILGYDKGTGLWKEPVNYTNILAGILWCMRVLVLEHTLPTDQRDELGRDTAIRPMERMKKVRDVWLVEEEDCPFATLHSLMNYGFVIAKDSVGNSRVKWSDDGQTILFQGHIMIMEQWKTFVFDIMTEAEEILSKRLMFLLDGKVPDINLWEFKDDQTREDIGYYFASEWKDGWDGGRSQMVDWLLEAGDPLGLLGEQDEGGVQEFIKSAVDEYNAIDREFRVLLYLVILFTAGGPPRGTEMMSIKFMNTRDGIRNFFVFLGRVMMVTSYHKSQGITGKEKVTPYYRYIY